jgi:hypothetical protein
MVDIALNVSSTILAAIACHAIVAKAKTAAAKVKRLALRVKLWIGWRHLQ